MPFAILRADAKSILSPVTGFLREARFTHSLTPARNCTFGCTYCYVPTMRIYGGLQRADWTHWGEHTTFKSNAAALLRRSLRADQIIYCSPLTDPYQPAEETECLMPGILDAVAETPPRVFVIQTRGTLILRDLDRLRKVSERTSLRIGFSVTTNREEVRRIYEPHCAPIAERWRTIETLRDAGLAVHAVLAPLLPCDPETLLTDAVRATGRDVICDPFHVREAKAHGATTRSAAERISRHHGWLEWHDPQVHGSVIERMQAAASELHVRFGAGPEAFNWLTRERN